MQSIAADQQFDGVVRDHVPMTPTMRQQSGSLEPSSPTFKYHMTHSLQPNPWNKPDQSQGVNTTQPIATNTVDDQVIYPATIVGPSDHYGVHSDQQRFFKSNLNNHNIYKGSPVRDLSKNRSAIITNENPNAIAMSDSFLSSNKPASRQMEETKVCVIVNSKTPVIIKVPIASTKITLLDLKTALPSIDQPNFKYFFKSNDSEFGIVKEEIQDNDCRLPTYRNRVVAWIVTPNDGSDDLASKFRSETSDTCNLTYTNTSFDDGSSSIFTTDIGSTSYYTETDDDDSISCSNYSETTCDTFISQRKNRFKQNNNKSPVSNACQSSYRALNHNSNHHHHDRLGNIESSPSSSSSSASSHSSNSYSDATAVHYVTVHLILTSENFLGLHIYANAIHGTDEGIYVDGITENSAVAQDGRIEPGDKLIQVNDANLEELTNDEAVKLLKEAVIKRGPLKLVVAKFIESNNKHDAASGLDREAIHPIDTAAWVAHAQAMTIPNSQLGDHVDSATSSPSFGSNAQDTDCIRPASTGINRLGPGLRLNKDSVDIKDIVMHMKLPNMGIELKDRKWLKIHIPQAFLGCDLIRWLERNVRGFLSESEARKFAASMLAEGYILDPLSKNQFSPKSFYTFR